MIEIKHWDISIQISQCFFFIFVCLNTSLYVKLGNINDLHRQLIQWEIHIGFNLRCQGVDQKCTVVRFPIHNVGESCLYSMKLGTYIFFISHTKHSRVYYISTFILYTQIVSEKSSQILIIVISIPILNSFFKCIMKLIPRISQFLSAYISRNH